MSKVLIKTKDAYQTQPEPFYAMATVALTVIVLTYLIVNSRFGLVLVAIREDEDAARVYGIATVRYKIAAFALSAFFPGDFCFSTSRRPASTPHSCRNSCVFSTSSTSGGALYSSSSTTCG